MSSEHSPELDRPTPLLDTINRPADLKSLSTAQLEQLATEIRTRILEIASSGGGHLAPHLGVVDLTLAIHHCFDTERDLLIWDVGHQTYAHKMITGRRDQMHTIRKRGGLSGYPRRTESPYDAFGVGHSSTSISAGLGMAVARDRKGENRRVISVIGDGAMTAGMAFEALSHAGHLKTNMIVVLNDNQMSISNNVGALSAYFNRIITGGLYNRAKGDVGSFMKRVLGSQLTWAARRFEHSVKGFVTPGTLFEELGWKYVGPVDGHCIETMVELFENVKELHGPILLHVVTTKGKGYPYAEDDPVTYHGVKAFDLKTGMRGGNGPSAPAPAKVRTFTDAFADALIAAARQDMRVVGITAAMPTGTGLSTFEEHFPDRVFDVGICEQHAVTFAAGLAAEGMKPVAAIYSTFLQRGYDQYVHDVCLQNLPVVFAIDRAGAVGEDSPTQQGAFDLSFLRAIPNIIIGAPRDDVDTEAMLHWALRQDTAVAMRYARGAAPTLGPVEGRDIARGEVLRDGRDLVLVGIGPIVASCLEVAEILQADGLSVGVADARWVKPLDAALFDQLRDRLIVTVEENSVAGGFGSAVLEHFESLGQLDEVRVRRIGFPDRFVEHATRAEQLADIRLDTQGILEQVRAFLDQAAHRTIR